MHIHMDRPWFISLSKGLLWGIETKQNFDSRVIAHSWRAKPTTKRSPIHVQNKISHALQWLSRVSSLAMH